MCHEGSCLQYVKKMVRHYLVAGCLQVACSYVKRINKREDKIGAQRLIEEIAKEMQEEDPVGRQ